MRKFLQQLGFMLTLALFLTGVASSGQSASVTIDQPYAGDRNVTGQAVSAVAPLTVYEVLGSSRNYLGKSSSLDQQGFYAINVSPELINGHQIVVVDGQGHSSALTTIVVKTGPAGPGS